MNAFQITVPATSGGLGPGLHTLGLALDIVNTVHVQPDEKGSEIEIEALEGGEAATPDPKDNLLCRAYRLWGEDTGMALPGARFRVECRIPAGKGLGSSAATIVAGLAAAARVAEEKDPAERLLRLASRLARQPNNVAAALMGGITTTFYDGDTVRALHLANHLTLGVALFVPEEGSPTGNARAPLPETVPLTDAVFDLERLAYLTTALIWGKWERIGPAMEDRLHRPYLLRSVPGLVDVIAAARAAGAYGAAPSGGGPSIIALGPRTEAEAFASAMEGRARELGWPGRGVVTQVHAAGMRLKDD